MSRCVRGREWRIRWWNTHNTAVGDINMTRDIVDKKNLDPQVGREERVTKKEREKERKGKRERKETQEGEELLCCSFTMLLTFLAKS